jgi:type II secretion system protein J
MRRGFTLLELLLSITLMAVIAASVYAMLHSGLLARRVAADAAGQGRDLALAIDQIAGTLLSAAPPRGVLAGEFYAENNDAETGDLLRFHAFTDAAGTDWGDVVKFEFRLDSDSEGGHNLVRTCWRNLLSTRTEEGETEILCRHVTGLEFRYYDGGEWINIWDSVAQGNLLPVAVEVTVSLAAPAAGMGDQQESESTLSRVISLPCATGQG